MDNQASARHNEELPMNLVLVKREQSNVLKMVNEKLDFTENNEDVDVDVDIKKEIGNDDGNDYCCQAGVTDRIESTKHVNVSMNEDCGNKSSDSSNTSDSQGDGTVEKGTKSGSIYGENFIARQAQNYSNHGSSNTQSHFFDMTMSMMGPQQFDLLNSFPLNLSGVDRLTQSGSKISTKPKNQRKVQNFPCKLCGRNFTRNHSLKRHILSLHNKDGEDVDGVGDEDAAGMGELSEDDDDPESDLFTASSGDAGPLGIPGDPMWIDELPEGGDGFGCKFCGKDFAQRLSLKRHIRRLHGKRPWTCGVCEMQFCEVGLLERHMRTHSGERPFECTICDAAFSKLGNLQRHEKIHTGIKPFTCDICSKAFQSSQELKRHARTHTKERPFKCIICEKTFSESCHLQRHMITHTGFKPFQCELCDKYFSQYDNLKQHMTTHTGERPHRCTECDKAFARQADVRKHMRVHTGERPFKCTECEKSFSVSSTLHKHMLTHTGEKRFLCEICDRSFALNCNLKKHVRTHFKPKTFMCGVCQADFNIEAELQEHIASSHNYGNDDGAQGHAKKDDTVETPKTDDCCNPRNNDEGSEESINKEISVSQMSSNHGN